MKYFISDVHFSADETLKRENRPFKSARQYDKQVVRTWNKQTKKGDTIFVIGDLIDCDNENDCGWKKSINFVKKIKADVVLVLGNNEERVIKYFFGGDFEKFREFCLKLGYHDVLKNTKVEIAGKKFFLVHDPAKRRNNMLNLFGHVHRAEGIYKPYGFNLSCDLNHFRLFSEEDISQLLKIKEAYWDKDLNPKNKKKN